MAIQLSTVKTAFGNYKRDISDVSNDLFVQWCNYIVGFVYDKLVDITPDKFLSTTTISVQNGTAAYDLPADFRDMKRVGTGLYSVGTNGLAVDSPLAMTGFANGATGYYLLDDQIVLTPQPQQSYSLILRYTPLEPNFTSINDYFTVDKLTGGVPLVRTSDLEYLVRAIDVQYTMWDADPSMESIADFRFVRILSEMLSRQRSTPNSYNLTDYSFAY